MASGGRSNGLLPGLLSDMVRGTPTLHPPRSAGKGYYLIWFVNTPKFAALSGPRWGPPRALRSALEGLKNGR